MRNGASASSPLSWSSAGSGGDCALDGTPPGQDPYDLMRTMPQSSSPLAVRRRILPCRSRRALRPAASRRTEDLPPRTRVLVMAFEQELAKREDMPIRRGRYAVVIAARNEAKFLRQTLETAWRNMPRGGEIVVVLNGCTDGSDRVVDKWRRSKPPGLQVRVIKRPKAGKLGALLAPEEIFRERGWFPETIVQLDADTRLGKGAIEALWKDVRQKNVVASSGKLKFTPPVAEAARELALSNQIDNYIHGAWGVQNVAGALAVTRTPYFFAAHRAAAREASAAGGEDVVITALLRFMGYETRVNSDVPIVTLGITKQRPARKQWTRYLSSHAQVEEMFGPWLEELSLGFYTTRFRRKAPYIVPYLKDYAVYSGSVDESVRRAARLFFNSGDLGWFMDRARRARQEQAAGSTGDDGWIPPERVRSTG